MKSNSFPINIEQYLKQEYEDASTEHIVKAFVDSQGNVSFNIRPHDNKGVALDFKANKNSLTMVVYKRRLEQEQIPS